jgi:hypothetical protein
MVIAFHVIIATPVAEHKPKGQCASVEAAGASLIGIPTRNGFFSEEIL